MRRIGKIIFSVVGFILAGFMFYNFFYILSLGWTEAKKTLIALIGNFIFGAAILFIAYRNLKNKEEREEAFKPLPALPNGN